MAPPGGPPFPRVWARAKAVGRAVRTSPRTLRRWEFWFLCASLAIGVPWLLDRVFAKVDDPILAGGSVSLPWVQVSPVQLVSTALDCAVWVCLIALLAQVVQGQREMRGDLLFREKGPLALAAGLLLATNLALPWTTVWGLLDLLGGVSGYRLGMAVAVFLMSVPICWVVFRISDAMTNAKHSIWDVGLLLSGALVLCAGQVALNEVASLLHEAVSRHSGQDLWDIESSLWGWHFLNGLVWCWLIVVVLHMVEQSARDGARDASSSPLDPEPSR